MSPGLSSRAGLSVCDKQWLSLSVRTEIIVTSNISHAGFTITPHTNGKSNHIILNSEYITSILAGYCINI